MERLEQPRVVRRKIFAGLSPAERKRFAELAGGALLSYSSIRGILTSEAERELVDRVKKGREVRFLDAGAGLGQGVIEAEKVHPKVRAFGLAPTTPEALQRRSAHLIEELPPKTQVPRERWILGYFEQTVVPDFFDVIQTHIGLHHAINQALALENLLNSLRKGGSLILAPGELITPRGLHHPEARQIFEKLRQQGFDAPKMGGAGVDLTLYAIAIKITRTGRGKADLSEFYSHPLNQVPIKIGERASNRHA